MIYRFKSRATGDLIMLGPQGDQLLQLLGREPAAQGIIEVAAIPAALAALQGAIAAERPPDAEDDDPAHSGQPPVGLRQRLWPMIEMLRQCEQAAEPVVWGV
jgi:hypothetical protein